MIVPTLPPTPLTEEQAETIRFHLQRKLASTDLDEATVRLATGRIRYAGSWAECDLKTDLREELLDALNYLGLMKLRLIRAELADQTNFGDIQSAVNHISSALNCVKHLPEFEGPTSNDWLRENA